MVSHPNHATGVGYGGRRPGRPKGAKNKRQVVQIETLTAGRKLQLEYMLEALNDPTTTEERRDRFAIAAAPYVHPRLTAVAEPKALHEMTDIELELVMRKELSYAESKGDREQAAEFRELLDKQRSPTTSTPRQGNGLRKPV